MESTNTNDTPMTDAFPTDRFAGSRITIELGPFLEQLGTGLGRLLAGRMDDTAAAEFADDVSTLVHQVLAAHQVPGGSSNATIGS